MLQCLEVGTGGGGLFDATTPPVMVEMLDPEILAALRLLPEDDHNTETGTDDEHGENGADLESDDGGLAQLLCDMRVGTERIEHDMSTFVEDLRECEQTLDRAQRFEDDSAPRCIGEAATPLQEDKARNELRRAQADAMKEAMLREEARDLERARARQEADAAHARLLEENRAREEMYRMEMAQLAHTADEERAKHEAEQAEIAEQVVMERKRLDRLAKADAERCAAQREGAAVVLQAVWRAICARKRWAPEIKRRREQRAADEKARAAKLAREREARAAAEREAAEAVARAEAAAREQKAREAAAAAAALAEAKKLEAERIAAEQARVEAERREAERVEAEQAKAKAAAEAEARRQEKLRRAAEAKRKAEEEARQREAKAQKAAKAKAAARAAAEEKRRREAEEREAAMIRERQATLARERDILAKMQAKRAAEEAAAEERRIREMAAVTIQAAWRNWMVAQAQALQLTVFDPAATMIQACWRGYRVRHHLDKVKRDLEREAAMDKDEFDEEIDLADFDLDEDALEASFAYDPTKLSNPTPLESVVKGLGNSQRERPSQPRTAWGSPSPGPMSTEPVPAVAQTTPRGQLEAAEEWGFKDGRTAALMLRRAKRMKGGSRSAWKRRTPSATLTNPGDVTRNVTPVRDGRHATLPTTVTPGSPISSQRRPLPPGQRLPQLPTAPPRPARTPSINYRHALPGIRKGGKK